MARKRARTPSQEAVPELMKSAGEAFELNERRTIGASDSAHQAVFGTYQGQEVVVKPFRSKFAWQKAHNEELVTQKAHKLGFDTVEPIKVIDLRRQRAALFISKYIPDVIGAHTLNYERDPESGEGKALTRPVSSIASSLGELHGRGLTHGDSQLKNFGFRAADSFRAEQAEPVMFDFESGMMHGMKGIGREMYVAKACEDVGRLLVSLGDRQYGGRQTNDASELVRETVMQPYMDSPAVEMLGQLALMKVIDHGQAKFMEGREERQLPVPAIAAQQ